MESPAPGEIVPNVVRDRRAEPGVRAAPKKLVRAGSKKCGKLGRALEDTSSRVDLLGGRFTIGAPASAKIVPAPDGTPDEVETRVVLESGGEGFAINARETFQLDPDLYEAEPDAPITPAKLDVEGPKFLKATFRNEEALGIEPVEVNGLRAYAARPKQPNAPPGRDTALVLALLLAHPDGMLEVVTFHVRGEHVRNAVGPALVGCTRAAEKIAATLAQGPREIDRTPGTRTLVSDALSVRVPRDYVVIPSKDAGRIHKLRPLGLFAGGVTVMIERERNEDVVKDADATVPGKLLGKDTVWRGQTSPNGGFLFATAPLPDGRFASVLVKATRQAKVLDEMRAVAETIAVAQ